MGGWEGLCPIIFGCCNLKNGWMNFGWILGEMIDTVDTNFGWILGAQLTQLTRILVSTVSTVSTVHLRRNGPPLRSQWTKYIHKPQLRSCAREHRRLCEAHQLNQCYSIYYNRLVLVLLVPVLEVQVLLTPTYSGGMGHYLWSENDVPYTHILSSSNRLQTSLFLLSVSGWVQWFLEVTELHVPESNTHVSMNEFQPPKSSK